MQNNNIWFEGEFGPWQMVTALLLWLPAVIDGIQVRKFRQHKHILALKVKFYDTCHGFWGHTYYRLPIQKYRTIYVLKLYCEVYTLQGQYTENWEKYIPRKETVRPQSKLLQFIYLWGIYIWIFPWSVCRFGWRKRGGSIVGIYKSITDISK